MRGKRISVRLNSLSDGITPAHAGKTSSCPLPFCIPADHPRACGENEREDGMVEVLCGSPPRMRGKLSLHPLNRHRFRITPAHAGKTPMSISMHLRLPDHPRACGENDNIATVKISKRGSPPRMRGKHCLRSTRRCRRRITPAHAGKTCWTLFHAFCASDHPRACGENQKREAFQLLGLGSPPRMRGKLCDGLHRRCGNRITPAHAGKTL